VSLTGELTSPLSFLPLPCSFRWPVLGPESDLLAHAKVVIVDEGVSCLSGHSDFGLWGNRAHQGLTCDVLLVSSFCNLFSF
jgi:hypothetical protein